MKIEQLYRLAKHMSNAFDKLLKEKPPQEIKPNVRYEDFYMYGNPTCVPKMQFKQPIKI